MSCGRWFPVVLLTVVSPLCAQRFDRETYRDIRIVRGRDVGYESVLKLRGGIAGTMPADEDEAAGRKQDITFDGFAYYHADSLGERGTVLDAYVGTDGAIVSANDAKPGQAGGRLELSWRYFPFYREGFYSNDDWVPTGRYEGEDFGAYLGFGGSPDEGVTIEGGPFYRRHRFDRNDTTSNDYTIPDNFNAYGFRTYFAQSSIALDRQYREPVSGFLLTVLIEYERNDSDKRFGTSLYQSTLASQYWRGLGRLEWYFPTASFGTVELALEGSWTDKDDRVYNNDTSKPIGHIWGDARVGLRLRLGPVRLIPFAQGQWTRNVDEFGVSSDDKFWYGGGMRARWDLGETVLVFADYSYLSNPNRTSVIFTDDFYGEHQFFAGVEVRFGGL